MTDNMSNTGGGGGSDTPRKEIYTYQAPWVVYSMAWSRKYVHLLKNSNTYAFLPFFVSLFNR